MPYSWFFIRRKLLRLVISVFIILPLHAHGAEWRDCEKAKLRELQLQRGSDSQKTSKGKSLRRNESRQQRVEEIDTWLWKNCREYSYELRQLEQEKM